MDFFFFTSVMEGDAVQGACLLETSAACTGTSVTALVAARPRCQQFGTVWALRGPGQWAAGLHSGSCRAPGPDGESDTEQLHLAHSI